ncbi:MAG TPA: TfuA-like protein [Nitrospiraceae bacterium]|jgi:hypothetical protein|nr:TfuA-like protein [Nitrospiraceae bacterium]
MIYVFTGPTINHDEARQELDAVYLPPVSQGDVYRVALRRPFAIGIIDGYFDRVPAVWHKEILWAMAQGIHVFGASSMGALRAAELAMFGMEGIGWIFQAFRDGILEDDDEVAIAHKADYTPLSEAMVNIRRTLEKAEIEGLVSSSSRLTLTSATKQLYYPDRTYPRILAEARRMGLPSPELARFEESLSTCRVDQKREDAIAMLRAVRCKFQQDPVPKSVEYFFESTYGWEELKHQAGLLDMKSSAPQAVFTHSVLEELRLNPEAYATAIEGCLTRHFAQEKMLLSTAKLDEASFLETVVEHRRRHGLQSADDLWQWIQGQRLNKEDFLQLMREENKLRQVHLLLAEPIQRLVPSFLKLTGQYSTLADRALHKQQVLSAMGLENPTADDTGLTDINLLKWYFSDRFRKICPKTLSSFIRHLGFRNKGDFIRAVRREQCYLTQIRGKNRPRHVASNARRTSEQHKGMPVVRNVRRPVRAKSV